MSTSPILVVGAGPSGLAAALTLAQNSVPVRIVDKSSEHHTSSRGSGMQPRTVEILKFLDLVETAKKYHAGVPSFRLYKLPGGTEVVREWNIFETFMTSPERPYDMLAVSQYRTEAILRNELAKFGVHVELRTEPVSMEQDADSVTVTMKITDEVGGEKIEKIKVPYVIGSDGARGMTRKAIGASLEGETRDKDGQVWADAVIKGLDKQFWHMWSIPNKLTISARPTFDARSFHVGVIGQNFDPKPLLSVQKFIEFFQEHTGRKDLVFDAMRMLTYWKPKVMMANKFYEGRIFITGDAAHVHPPSGGQGLNTSVQDSFNLAWKLALAYKGYAAPDLLASYQAERLPIVTRMLIATSGLYKYMVAKNAEGVKTDDNQVAKSEGDEKKSNFVEWKDQSLRMLEINFRWSPVVYDVRGTLGLGDDDLKARAYSGYPGGDVHAGDRAPSASGLVDASGVETTLFDIFKPWYHTALVFTPGTEKAGAEVEKIIAALQAFPTGTVKAVVLCRQAIPKVHGGTEAYHDTNGGANKAYHIEEGAVTVIVVRPDGYVGAFVQDAEDLQKYFSKVFRSA